MSLLGAELALVEREFLALEDVAVSAAALSGARRDGSQQATFFYGDGVHIPTEHSQVNSTAGFRVCEGNSKKRAIRALTLHKLINKKLFELAVLLALLALALHLVGASFDLVLGGTLGEEVFGEAVVGSVGSLEGGGVDLDDAALDEGLGAHQLVVGGVVDHVQDAGLAGSALGSPGERWT